MGWMSKVGEMLQKYDSDAETRNEPEVVDHFSAVAEAAPKAEVSSGISEAFRSEKTPPFEDMVSRLFGSSDPSQKAGLVNLLLLPREGTPLDSLFQRLGLPTKSQPSITPEQAQNIDPERVRTAVAEIREKDPSVLERAGDFYAEHPSLVKKVGGAALAVALAHIARRARVL